MLIEFLVSVIIVIVFIVLLHRKPSGLPPGEWGLPIVGYVPYMNWKVSTTLLKLQEKHGKIYSLKLGALTFIVVGDYQLIKEAYNRVEISGRPYLYTYDVMLRFISLGIVTSSGQIWALNRRFAMKALKDFGLGKSKLEEVVHTEAEYLVKELKEIVNKSSRIDWNLNVAVVNVIWRLVANCRFNINDKEIQEFVQTSNECLEDIEGPMAILNIFPWLLPILPKFILNSFMRLSRVEEKRDKLFTHFQSIIKEHKKTLDANDPKDYIDKYLIEMEKVKDNPDYEHFGETDLQVAVFELFIAGSDTTSSTLRWFFLFMAKYPKIQKKIQQEIDQVLPREKLPSMQDKDRLPCLQALSYEIGRTISLLPNSVGHMATEDTKLAGYFIPKGSIVVPNIESIHKDPRYWEHPDEFKLENFLDKDGKFVPKAEGFMPFSIGRRQCLGEPLAKMGLFLFTGAILQNFDILEPEGQNLSLIPDQNVNLFNFPKKFDILLRNRK